MDSIVSFFCLFKFGNAANASSRDLWELLVWLLDHQLKEFCGREKCKIHTWKMSERHPRKMRVLGLLSWVVHCHIYCSKEFSWFPKAHCSLFSGEYDFRGFNERNCCSLLQNSSCAILFGREDCTNVGPGMLLCNRRWREGEAEAGWYSFLLLCSTSVNHPRNSSFAKRIKSKEVAGPNLVLLTEAKEGIGLLKETQRQKMVKRM